MGKAFGQALRIAGILHCAIWQDKAAETPIEYATVCAAGEIIRYFYSHAKAVFTDIGMTQEIADARTLFRKMKASGEVSFNKRALYKLTNGNIPKKRLEAALSQLLRAQRIRIEDETAEDKKRIYTLICAETQGLDESEWELC